MRLRVAHGMLCHLNAAAPENVCNINTRMQVEFIIEAQREAERLAPSVVRLPEEAE